MVGYWAGLLAANWVFRLVNRTVYCVVAEKGVCSAAQMDALKGKRKAVSSDKLAAA